MASVFRKALHLQRLHTCLKKTNELTIALKDDFFIIFSNDGYSLAFAADMLFGFPIALADETSTNGSTKTRKVVQQKGKKFHASET